MDEKKIICPNCGNIFLEEDGYEESYSPESGETQYIVCPKCGESL